MHFQAPTSLAGTLAAYEQRRKSLNIPSQTKLAASSVHQEHIHVPSAGDIYQRSLPSLHFLRWRPMYHLQAPSGWMNDPAGTGYDPTTQTYHMFFQWNPKRTASGSVGWGSIAWGHATSKDMVSWSVDGKAALKPEMWYDREGVFTGCLVPTGLDGKSGLTIFYTGVTRMPLHYAIPYKNGTEVLAVAQPNDSGGWSKMRGNPLLKEPPPGVSVSGFRDPFVAKWIGMDRVLGQQEGATLYGVISGGLKDKTPTVFLYAVNPHNLLQWAYMDAIVNIGHNHCLSRWSGDMGINWECVNFMTLTSEVDGSSRDFLVLGTEASDSSNPLSTFAEHPQLAARYTRPERSLQWMSGNLVLKSDNAGKNMPRMEYISGGRFDHSLLYAVNSFHDVQSGRQTAFGWITEDDLPQRLVDRMNWSGMISIPRELSLIVLTGVVGALTTPLKDITSFEVQAEESGTSTVRTLGISPHRCLESLRRTTRYVEISRAAFLQATSQIALDVATCRFELAAAFDIADNCERVGLSIYHDEDKQHETSTTLYFLPARETFMIERPTAAHVDPEISTTPERAPFTLLNLRNADGKTKREQLQIRAYFDESVLEVFINDRCTFATRIYPASKRCYGIRFWAHDSSGQTQLTTAKAWDGLRANMSVV